MTSWRDDPELVRQGDEDELQRVEVPDEWEQLFAMIGQMFVGSGGGMVGKAQRVVLKGLVWQARKRVSAEPDEAREFGLQSVRAIAACLRLEPVEMYPDWQPPAAAASDASRADPRDMSSEHPGDASNSEPARAS